MGRDTLFDMVIKFFVDGIKKPVSQRKGIYMVLLSYSDTLKFVKGYIVEYQKVGLLENGNVASLTNLFRETWVPEHMIYNSHFIIHFVTNILVSILIEMGGYKSLK